MGQKVESGDGRPLEPVRGWEKLWRSSFGADIDGARYDIDLNFFDFDEKVRLFVGGRLSETRDAPAKFPRPGWLRQRRVRDVRCAAGTDRARVG